MSLAGRCEVDNVEPRWNVLRRGDAVVSWACDKHLAEVCSRLQRDSEVTELVVRDDRKACEWAGIHRDLERIMTEGGVLCPPRRSSRLRYRRSWLACNVYGPGGHLAYRRMVARNGLMRSKRLSGMPQQKGPSDG